METVQFICNYEWLDYLFVLYSDANNGLQNPHACYNKVASKKLYYKM